MDSVLKNLEKSIEELRALEERLCEKEECLHIVADFANDWEYWQGENGEYRYVSPSVQSLTGYTPAEFYQNPLLLRDIVDSDSWEEWVSHKHEMSENGEVEPIEFKIRTKSGETKWIHHVCRTVNGKKGENRGIRGSNRDVTKQKHLQAEVETLREILPICSSCKKIRDSEGYWEQVESYIGKHSNIQFSHSLCEDCAEKLYGDNAWFKKIKDKKNP